MAAVSCQCIFCWPRKAIENEGAQPIFEVNDGLGTSKNKMQPQNNRNNAGVWPILFSVYFYFFIFKGASPPPFYLGTSILIGTNLGSSWRNKLGQVGRAAWAEAGPNPRQILRTQCDTLNTCIFAALFPMFGFPTLGLSWDQLGRQSTHTGVKPNLCSNGPRCAMLDPSWAQVGANWPEVGASQTEVGVKLLQVAPWASTFPVYPILWMRAVLVAKLLE